MQDDDDPLSASQGEGSIPDFRENFIATITATLQSDNFLAASRRAPGGQHFTRKRKLPFIHLIILLTQGLTKSLQRELNSFFQRLRNSDFPLQEMTKSALTHARAKLNPDAFKMLNQAGIEAFYREAPYLKWHGFRLLAIDGSTLMLPSHSSTEREFGLHSFGQGEGAPRPMARISMLYDVLNLTTLDAEMSRIDDNERDMARRHFAYVQPERDLLIFDRGYPSYALMYELQQRGIDYCMRLQDDWWREVLEMRKAGEQEKLVQFKLRGADRRLIALYGAATDLVTCRVVIVDLPGGTTEVLATSVLDDCIRYEDFATLYHYRWNIEEGFKLYKCRAGMDVFSGKTAHAVRQDFFAKVFMMTTAAVMAFPIEEQLKKEQTASSVRRVHTYKVNRTNALAMLRQGAVGIFLRGLLRPALRALDNLLRRTLEAVRPGRQAPRKHRRKPPPSMGYKEL